MPDDNKTDKSEIKKVGSGQPIDEVALWSQMEDDRMDKMIGRHGKPEEKKDDDGR